MQAQLDLLLAKQHAASLKVLTLGRFEVWENNERLSPKAFGRDKAVQLFQFFLMARNRRALHKEQIVDRLWENDIDDQGFKVALHGINKALEPDRKSHGETKYFHRVGQTYQLDFEFILLDSWMFEQLVSLGNQAFVSDTQFAVKVYREALTWYGGTFLPNRIYEDWSSDERERLQLMFLSTTMALAELMVDENPLESIQYCQEALLVDVAWEEAYRIQMKAYLNKGNRPMALKTYETCEKVLYDELGIKPLPETKKVLEKILNA